MSDELWVFDRAIPRYSRFTAIDGEYTFKDSFTPSSRPGFLNEFIVEDRESYWCYGGTRSLLDEDEKSSLSRFVRLNIHGDVVQKFGPPWSITSKSAWSILSPQLLNEGHLLELKGGRVAFVWQYRPRIEIWSKDGELLVGRDLESPPWPDIPEPVRQGSGSILTSTFMNHIAYDHEADLLFLMRGLELNQSRMALELVGLETRTLSEVESYHVVIPGARPRRKQRTASLPKADEVQEIGFSVGHFLVNRDEGAIQFIAIELKSLTLMRLTPQ